MVKLTEQNREQYNESILQALKAEDVQQFRQLFLELHPQDQHDFFLGLDEAQREKVYEYLSPEEFAEIFQELELEEQKDVIEELDQNYATNMFGEMSTDDVADFLGEVPEAKVKTVLEGLEADDAKDIRELLSYEEETAGAIMTKEFMNIPAEAALRDVIELLRKEGPDAETIYYLYVVNAKQELAGVVSLRDLITADPNKKVEDVMSTRVVSVNTGDDQEDVAKLFKKYDFLAVPVVTNNNTLVGIITVDDIIDVIEEEATEDIGEFVASRGATDVNITSFTAAKKRSPWIVMLMFFGLITAGVIGTFEETLEQIVVLAAFIPLIMDSAGNTGTQSLAVMVRSLATGSFEKKGMLNTVKREFGTGLYLGVFCAITLMVVIPFIYDWNFMLAGVVGVSLFITLSIATIIGAVVPVIINKMKLDPAIASGPFITTINDILGLMIYFSIATALIQYL
ncbi:magnesium transporter [Alteribacter natronophilus]|uniref:magnesium transporter n=1 Tax=Alteribacter natronophilus TaxID=2583810 RepID=UPI00110EB5B4|nr:magnesium transporter [Alteribacter natronophilus]TMW70387.1 magnesium transporter [Alteribacter natronophilus]